MVLFLAAILVGLIGQTIDGALGMAYGVSCNTFLLTLGLAPALASASVKTAEVFTTAVSGISHLRFGNVDKRLFFRLMIPGVIGGSLGAYVLGNLPGEKARPFVALYLLIMGIVILTRALRNRTPRQNTQHRVTILGFFGGFLDAVGGGGWGPIVTSNLIARGQEPRTAIGSMNLAEFFVTLAQVATFTAVIGLQHSTVVLGLVLGGLVAAPFAAYCCKKIPSKRLMIIVAALIIALSLRNLLVFFF